MNHSAGSEDVRNSTYCGGVLVGEKADGVLTASHCIEGGAVPDVLVDVDNLCGVYEADQRFGVTEVVLGKGKYRELAYLALEGEVGPSHRVSRLSGSAKGEATNIALGWGFESQGGKRPCVRKTIPLMPTGQSTCAIDIEEAGVEDIRDSIRCYLPTKEVNTCQGDSGGGVYAIAGEKSKFVAMTLGGSGCEFDDPGLYLTADLALQFYNEVTS